MLNTVRLKLPGRPRSETTAAEGALIGANVRLECDLGVARRDGRTDEAVVTDANENDVVQLRWESGIVELVCVGELQQRFGGAVRSGGDELTVPQFRALATTTRDGAGAGALALDSVQHIAVDLRDAPLEKISNALSGQVVERVSQYVLPPVVRKIEEQFIPRPGLCLLDESGAVQGPPPGAASADPYLVLVHGTFSNTDSAFKQLFASKEWKELHRRYAAGHVLGLEQRTVSESPASNALSLVQGLPAGARVHLLTHSRGGLVGDLLCRSPWQDSELDLAFAGDQFAGVRADLQKLGKALFTGAGRALRVERFLRVAAPVAGTQLAGPRLDQFLSIGLTLLGKLLDAGTGWFSVAKSIAVQIVAARTRADACPGLEAMMPESPFIRFLNLAPREGEEPQPIAPNEAVADWALREQQRAEPHRRELAVISGDVQGGRWFQRVKQVFVDFYFRKKANDFVVDTASMTRGVVRKNGLHYQHRGPDADHFSYFRDPEVRRRVRSYLAEGSDEGFLDLERGVDPIPTRTRFWLGDTKLKAPVRADVPTVLLVPGIMGTRLADADGNLIWVNPLELGFGGMKKLQVDRAVRALDPIELSYQRLVSYLERELNVELFGFDWRQSIEVSSNKLADKLDALLASTGKQPVHLVAHSMGGLLSRGMIVWRNDVWRRFIERGGRLLMLGTPNYGSFAPAEILVGQSAQLRKLAFLDLASNLASLREIVMGFPGLLEMLPRRGTLDWLDYKKWSNFPHFRPSEELLKKASDVRKDLDEKTGGWEQSMFYVAGSGRTAVELALSSTGAAFSATDEGDETVPWALGKLDGVPTYYVPAKHGDLADHPAAFPGYLELLKTGKTGLLAAEQRARTTTAAVTRDGSSKAVVLERLDATPPPLMMFPSESDVLAGFLGSDEGDTEQSEQTLSLSVINGHMHASRYPILVGHYEGDAITSAEGVLDDWLNGQLSRDHALRIYPGPIGSMRWYRHHTVGERSVIVVGLGQMRGLTRPRLTETIVEGLLRYAADRYQLAARGTPLELTLTSLLIGSWGKLTVEDSVCAVIGAVRECNRRLSSDPSRLVKYVAIQFMELYRDLATQAAHALQRLQEGDDSLRLEPHMRSLGTFRRNRPASHTGYYERVAVLAELGLKSSLQLPVTIDVPSGGVMVSPPPPPVKRPELIRYRAVTGLARADLLTRCVQWAHIEKLLKQAPLGDKASVGTLVQYLLPFEFKNQARDAGDLVLELDPWTAQIPWELMSGYAVEGDELVERGILRTLQIDRPRQPQPTTEGRALVIAEPAGVTPALPGALKEGEKVERLLRASGMLTNFLPGADADQNFQALLAERYDIVHIAGHGHYDAQNPRHSGVVLANGRFLTACEFENLKATPSVVFLNCCHLGQIRLQEPGAWGASVAEELIRIGVGVVVVAGWAVSDHAALVFAETLYGNLLKGSTLMSAVREARRKTRDATGGSDVTWGAYQIYGDPGFVLPNRTKAGESSARAATWVSPHELVEQVLDLEVRASKRGERAGGGLDIEVTSIWDSVPTEWRERGDVNAAFGKVYGALGNFKKAIERYTAASSSSDAELATLEQLANYQAREAVRLVESASPSQEELQSAVALFESSRAQLDRLLTFGKSEERYALLGATLRRMARCEKKRPGLLNPSDPSYVVLAFNAYDEATRQPSKRRYYPLLQVQGLNLCLGNTVDDKTLQPARDAAREASLKGDAFGDVVLIELDVLAAAAQNKGSEVVSQLASDLWEAFEASGVAEERRESLTNNWQTLTVLAPPPIRAWLESLLQALGVPVP